MSVFCLMHCQMFPGPYIGTKVLPVCLIAGFSDRKIDSFEICFACYYVQLGYDAMYGFLKQNRNKSTQNLVHAQLLPSCLQTENTSTIYIRLDGLTPE